MPTTHVILLAIWLMPTTQFNRQNTPNLLTEPTFILPSTTYFFHILFCLPFFYWPSRYTKQVVTVIMTTDGCRISEWRRKVKRWDQLTNRLTRQWIRVPQPADRWRNSAHSTDGGTLSTRRRWKPRRWTQLCSTVGRSAYPSRASAVAETRTVHSTGALWSGRRPASLCPVAATITVHKTGQVTRVDRCPPDQQTPHGMQPPHLTLPNSLPHRSRLPALQIDSQRRHGSQHHISQPHSSKLQHSQTHDWQHSSQLVVSDTVYPCSHRHDYTPCRACCNDGNHSNTIIKHSSSPYLQLYITLHKVGIISLCHLPLHIIISLPPPYHYITFPSTSLCNSRHITMSHPPPHHYIASRSTSLCHFPLHITISLSPPHHYVTSTSTSLYRLPLPHITMSHPHHYIAFPSPTPLCHIHLHITISLPPPHHYPPSISLYHFPLHTTMQLPPTSLRHIHLHITISLPAPHQTSNVAFPLNKPPDKKTKRNANYKQFTRIWKTGTLNMKAGVCVCMCRS